MKSQHGNSAVMMQGWFDRKAYEEFVVKTNQVFLEQTSKSVVGEVSYLAVLKKHINNAKQNNRTISSVLLNDGEDYRKPSVLLRLFDQIIQNNIAFDHAAGIVSGMIEVEGEFVMLRDKRERGLDDYLDQSSYMARDVYHYKNMQLNYAVAFLTILQSHGVKYNEERFLQCVLDYMNEPNEQVLNRLKEKELSLEAYFLGFVEHVLYNEWLYLPECNLPSSKDKSKKKLSLAEFMAMLDNAKSWCAMLMPSYHIVTKTKLTGTNSALRLSTPLVSTYSDDKVLQEHCHVVWGALREERHHNQKWFKALKSYEKRLYDRIYQQKVLAGRVKPSQLRTKLPGLSNGKYAATYFVSKKGTMSRVEKVAQCFHNGALPALADGADLMSTAYFAAEQQRYYAHKMDCNRHIMVTLNSRVGDVVSTLFSKNGWKVVVVGLVNMVWGVAVLATRLLTFNKLKPKLISVPVNKKMYDRKIVQSSYRAAKQLNKNIKKLPRGHCGKSYSMGSANLCVNGYRLLESPQDKDITRFLKNARHARDQIESYRCKLYKKQQGLLDKMLRVSAEPDQTSCFKSLLGKINEIQREIVSLQLTLNRFDSLLDDAKERTSWQRRMKRHIGDKNINHMYLLSVLNRLSLEVNKADEKLPLSYRSFDNTVIYFGCASGENRTEWVNFITQVGAIDQARRDAGVSCANLNKVQILELLAEDGHGAMAMSTCGSDAGRYGLRRKTAPPKKINYSKDEKSELSVVCDLCNPAADIKSAAALYKKCRKSGDKLLGAKDYEKLTLELTKPYANHSQKRQNANSITQLPNKMAKAAASSKQTGRMVAYQTLNFFKKPDANSKISIGIMLGCCCLAYVSTNAALLCLFCSFGFQSVSQNKVVTPTKSCIS